MPLVPPRLVAALAATTVGLGSLAAVAPPATARAAAPTPGGESAGDPLFPSMGNSGYQVRHYAIRLAFAPATGRIEAAASVFARARHPLSSYSLDLQGLHVRSVRVDGHPARFERHGHKLVVTPRRAVRGRFTTSVAYAGRPTTHIDPDGSSEGWVPTDDGATVVSEPVGAMTWFPDNNTPRDKATFAVRVTAPSALAVAGNGELVRRHTDAGRTTWTWRQGHRMAPYLAMVSIGRYSVHHSTMRTSTGRRLPVWSFVDPRYGSQAAVRRLVPTAVRFLERRYGRYPFSSTGVVIDHVGVGYALETQNRPVFDGAPDPVRVVHELAHQWYGDSVTLTRWTDLWLHEGFATYSEDLWNAAHGGPSPTRAFRERYDANPASSSLWSPAPARFSDPADMFGAPVYERGAMTLQVLRSRIGTADFFTVMRAWAAAHREGHGTTAQFVALAERVSGQALGTLFHDWLYVAARPDGY